MVTPTLRPTTSTERDQSLAQLKADAPPAPAYIHDLLKRQPLNPLGLRKGVPRSEHRADLETR